MIEHFADLLRAQAPRDRCRPASTEQALVGGLATMMARAHLYVYPLSICEPEPLFAPSSLLIGLVIVYVLWGLASRVRQRSRSGGRPS